MNICQNIRNEFYTFSYGNTYPRSSNVKKVRFKFRPRIKTYKLNILIFIIHKMQHYIDFYVHINCLHFVD